MILTLKIYIGTDLELHVGYFGPKMIFMEICDHLPWKAGFVSD